MSFDRDALITAYRAHYGASGVDAEQAVRSVEMAYATKQNAELLDALDAADGEHLKQTEDLRQANASLQRMLERGPETHMRFGFRGEDSTFQEADQCADWCIACKLQALEKQRDEAVYLASILAATGPDGAHLCGLIMSKDFDAVYRRLKHNSENRRRAQSGPA